MDYRTGDVPTPIGPLRLTVGALAEMAERLDAPSPTTLSNRIRVMTPETARHLLIALLRPSGRAAQVAGLSDAQVAARMPDVSRCIVQAFQ
jgi:hypothetical protein